MGRDTVTGADVLVAIFDEKESHAVWLLAEQEMMQQDAANIIAHDSPRVSQRRNTQPVVKRRARKRSKPAGQ
jgi:ATP-dependent Clp protease ATP-binding subunit ClpA